MPMQKEQDRLTVGAPTLCIGSNPTLIWGMTAAERVRRIVAAQRFENADGGVVVANLAYAFDPAWLAHLATRPGSVLTREGVPVLAYVSDAGDREAIVKAMHEGRPLQEASGLVRIAAEVAGGIFNEQLRKRETPFAERLEPASVRLIEEASYRGAYKGVTDLLTKYLWPRWALALTRFAAGTGVTPNQVTAVGTVLCIVETIAFWRGWFWTGLTAGLVFMVLDTVDGKLARCTITSSKLGNAWDHGIDLVHPPFWWWAWASGCAVYGRPLTDDVFYIVMAAMLFGYVAQRLIEGAFILRFGMHIHVWQRFDSAFRLVTARRNPNMVILFVALLVGRPDWGIVGVAVWTMVSLLVHLVRLIQATVAQRSGPLTSWLA